MTFRSTAGHGPANRLLPSGLRVANVWTAGPGVQVENVSARGRRTRYQRVPGSLRNYWALAAFRRVSVGPASSSARELPGQRAGLAHSPSPGDDPTEYHP